MKSSRLSADVYHVECQSRLHEVLTKKKNKERTTFTLFSQEWWLAVGKQIKSLASSSRPAESTK